jgi:pimeloyl-ACP methyl ester carboxylesterase
MKNPSILLILFLLLFNYNLNAQNSKNDYPAISEEITITIGKDSIAAFGMLAAGKEKKETVILLHGLPGNERNLDLAHELRRNGRNVIYFNYRGAWGSQGEFLYSNCIEDVKKVMDFFDSPKNSEKYRIKPKSYILFGHSMGGGIALLSGAKEDRVKKIAIYSPAHIGTASQGLLDWVYDYTKSLFMLNVNPEKFYKELVDNKDSFNALNYKKELSQKNLLILDENERNKEWIEQLDNVEYLLMKTDHSFSDKRLELIDKITKWINN